MLKQIAKELRNHAPFTGFGSVTGIVLMMFSQRLPRGISLNIFYLFHPLHVVLSALVTASTFEIHECKRINVRCFQGKCNFWKLFIVGYLGSIGIATLSDSLIPYLGEVMLEMPNRGIHIGFIEKWWLVNPLAVAGVTFAFLKPTTKFPHAGHVLLSTWASLFHILMAAGESLTGFSYIVIFVFLFLAFWVPCCVSDIVFPLLFVKEQKSKD